MVSVERKQPLNEQEKYEDAQQPVVEDSAFPDGVVIRLDAVTKDYGGVPALRDVSLDVRRGEVLGLLGPTGCGKTVLLRLAAGLERVSRGEITLGGVQVDSRGARRFVPPESRNLGLLAHSHALWPHMTVFENVSYGLRARRMEANEVVERVSLALEQAGLPGYEQRRITTLAPHQKQRVALARSLAYRPGLLLLDDPFRDLDGDMREQMRADLKVLQRRLGASMIFATADQTDALAVSDSLAIMDTGVISQVGTPADLYRRPTTQAARDRLGRTVTFQAQVSHREPGEIIAVRLHDVSGPVLRVARRPAMGLSQGDWCTVTVRPEAIRAVHGADGGQANTVNGKVITLLFTGAGYEAVIGLPWDQNIPVRMPAEGQWREGQDIILHLPAEDLHVWPA
ncbi:MAG: ABC transporter ATP-binding protein [Dehalococcoidia bacterium]